MEHYIIVGLGNPGDTYERTRHNAGRMVVEMLGGQCGVESWRVDTKRRVRIAEAVSPRTSVPMQLVLPDTYMNRSGDAVASVVPLVAAPALVVVHDDIDLPLGTIRISFDRGAGGHNGVASIEHVLKTRAFARVRVGVLPEVDGVVRKPKGEERVNHFLLAPMQTAAYTAFRLTLDRAVAATLSIVEDGREAAMRTYNGVVAESARDEGGDVCVV